MNTNLTVQSKKLNAFDIAFIAWGCITLPLWILALYQSFEDGAIYLQGIALASMAIAITLCWIVSPWFKRTAAIIAIGLSCTFTSVGTVNNININNNNINFNKINHINSTISYSWVVQSLIFDIVFFIAPAILLLYLSNFQHNSQTNPIFNPAIPEKWTLRNIALGVLLLLLLLVVIVGMYGLGSESVMIS